MCPVKIFDYKINADLNKNVFNLDLKIANILLHLHLSALILTASLCSIHKHNFD